MLLSLNDSTIGSRGNTSLFGTSKILSSLPAPDYERLEPHLKTVPLKQNQVLIRQGDRVDVVLFPTGGVLSLMRVTNDGHTAEVAAVGDEGVIGSSVFFGLPDSISDVIVQVASGVSLGLPVEVFRAEMKEGGAFFNRVSRYTQALMTEVIQTATCNALHSAEQRCCRRLLIMHDRVGRDEFPMTHEFLAAILGVRRPTVTVVARSLQNAGIISCRRGSVRILSREALQSAACECYGVSVDTFHRLLPEIAIGSR